MVSYSYQVVALSCILCYIWLIMLFHLAFDFCIVLSIYNDITILYYFIYLYICIFIYSYLCICIYIYITILYYITFINIFISLSLSLYIYIYIKLLSLLEFADPFSQAPPSAATEIPRSQQNNMMLHVLQNKTRAKSCSPKK